MSTLIPTPRADKNGKIVIRHMKPDTDEETGAVTLPAPATAATPSQPGEGMEEVINDLVAAVREATADLDDTDPEDATHERLRSLSNFTLIDLDEISREDPDKFYVLARLVEMGEDEAFINNYIAFSDLEGGTPDDLDIALVRTIDHLPQLEKYNYNVRVAPYQIQEGVRALLEVTRAVRDMPGVRDVDPHDFSLVRHQYDFQNTPVIQNKKTVEYIMSNPEKASEIAAAIESRKVFDPSVIDAIVSHPEPALSSGAL